MPRDDRVDAVLEHLLAERSAGRSGCYLSSEAVERLLAAAASSPPRIISYGPHSGDRLPEVHLILKEVA